ncbi:MAG: hypothetical protein H6773_02245 [Pseudomonadales bacterium]|nr:hypothetical protein [Pseudomonadales bacterium]
MDIVGIFQEAFAHTLANADLFLIPALIYALVATGAALLLGWGRVFYEQVGDTFVLKLPGGGLLASMPIPELFLLGLVLSLEPIQAGTPFWGLAHFLTFFATLRICLAVITHALAFLGSMMAYASKLHFSVECMDGRCEHGSRSGNFLHYHACGGATLLTAVTFAPFVVLPVFVGVADGVLGWVLLGASLLPYPFMLAKLFVGMFGEGMQRVLKGATDIIMFLTEWPGWLLGSITLTVASLRPMFPGVTKTHFHKH